MLTYGLWLGWIACTGADSGVDDSGEAPTDSGEEDSDVPGSDEALLRAVIAGDADLATALQTVFWSGGLPVVTDSGTVLFVRGGNPDGWAVAGDFSDWEPIALQAGEGFGWAEVALDGDPAGLGYKFTDGTTWQDDPASRSYRHDENGRLSYVAPPKDTWRLDRWPGLEGQGLAPRTVRVYVPPGDGPFPVIYAHDGQNLFDPEAAWGGWRLPDALSEASSPLVVVGVDNTGDRMDEYTHVADQLDGTSVGGKGDAYADLVLGDLAPRMNDAYPLSDHVGVMGSSLGGLVSLHMGLRYPADVDVVLALSSTLGWGRYGDVAVDTMTDRYLAAGPTQGQLLFVDSGGTDGGDGCTDPDGDGSTEDDPNSADNYCVTRAFVDTLATNGWAWETDLVHWHEPGATHDEAAWAARVHRPLAAFLDAAP